jgi:uncharacterized protein with NRDE domain
LRGGTWLGLKPAPSAVDRRYRFAVVHNFRHRDEVDPGKKSRGELPVSFLRGNLTAEEYAHKVSREGADYMPFTLVLVDEKGVYFTSNRGPTQKLRPGTYCLSNALLDTPWPKASHGKDIFRSVIRQSHPRLAHDHEQEDELFHQMCHRVLRDNTIFPHPLPGIQDAHTEIFLSSIFIEPYKWKDWGFYGTRMQTLCVIRADGSVRVQEYTLDTATSCKDWRGAWSRVQFELNHRLSPL